MKRLHGDHNKTVCDILHFQEKCKCNDWVITTAFYSSIHYLDHALFPCTYKGNEFKNINEAHKFISSSSKHQTRSILISNLLPKHAGDYEFLKEEAHNARYVEYNINEAISMQAVRRLEAIITSYNKEKKEIVLK